MKVVVFGSDGMLGEVVSKYFREKFFTTNNKLICPERKTYDARDLDSIEKIIRQSKPDYVINCVGILNNKTDVDLYAKVNVVFPHFLQALSNKYDYKLFHISTNCVFANSDKFHAKDEIPNATDLYGMSKAFGEIIDNKNVTIRTSIIGQSKNGSGLLNWFLNNNESMTGYVSAQWNGITTLELAKQIYSMIEGNYGHGLYQIATEKSMNKYELLCLFNVVYCANKSIMPGYKQDVHSSLLISGIKVKSIEEQLLEFKRWYK